MSAIEAALERPVTQIAVPGIRKKPSEFSFTRVLAKVPRRASARETRESWILLGWREFSLYSSQDFQHLEPHPEHPLVEAFHADL